MAENNKKTNEDKSSEVSSNQNKSETGKKELSIEEKLKDTEDKLLRSLAEIENQRRRFEKDVKDAFEFGSFNFAKESLAILDNLQRAKIAIKNDQLLKSNKDLDKFLENISIIEKDLITIFEKNKIKKIEAVGEKFDPNLHQAGTIIQEIQSGYMLGERLLRPALVGISKKNNTKNGEKEEKKEKK